MSIDPRHEQMKIILFFIIFWLFIFLNGCATQQVATPIEVKVPVPVLCTTPTPQAPETIACYKDTQNIFEAVKCMLYERQLDKAYQIELTAALESCK